MIKVLIFMINMTTGEEAEKMLMKIKMKGDNSDGENNNGNNDDAGDDNVGENKAGDDNNVIIIQ